MVLYGIAHRLVSREGCPFVCHVGGRSSLLFELFPYRLPICPDFLLPVCSCRISFNSCGLYCIILFLRYLLFGPEQYLVLGHLGGVLFPGPVYSLGEFFIQGVNAFTLLEASYNFIKSCQPVSSHRCPYFIF